MLSLRFFALFLGADAISAMNAEFSHRTTILSSGSASMMVTNTPVTRPCTKTLMSIVENPNDPPTAMCEEACLDANDPLKDTLGLEAKGCEQQLATNATGHTFHFHTFHHNIETDSFVPD